MKLYRVLFDGRPYWVEAPSFGEAVKVWRSHVQELWGMEYTGEEEPESVELMHDESVIRAAS